MILVTGANGNVGSEVVRQLVAKGQKVRALVRDAAKAKFGAGVEVAIGDLSKPETLPAALAGVDKVFSLAAGPVIAEQESNLFAAAKAAGVKHLVKLSVSGAQYEPGIALGRWHRAGEKLLEASGLGYTIVRPVGFMSNAFQWLGSIKEQGAIYSPAGNGKQSLIDVRDIAAFAVHALTTSGHEGKAYDISGSDSLTVAEQAALIGAAIGKPVKHVDVPDAAALQGMISYGMPAVLADAIIELFGLIKAGHGGGLTDTFEKVMGHKPRTFAAWVQENAGAFR